MKKVFLSLAVIAALTVVSCKQSENAEAPAADTTAVVADTTVAPVADTTAVPADTTAAKTEAPATTEAAKTEAPAKK
ncbi:hypothetical protein [Flavobacterium sp.]|uniref:hypothetical protein n=1 Tax=Flavobacterium sp. TaxID=239 RepID=UPI00374FDC62